MTPLPPRVVVRHTSAGERWRLRGQGWLAAAFAGVAVACAVLAWSAGSYAGRTLLEQRIMVGLAVACLVLSGVSALLAVGSATAGMRLDAAGVTARGVLRRRRLAWSDVRSFDLAVVEHVPNRPAAAVVAKLRDGRYVTLPGSRVEGLRWNLDRHREIAGAMARELDRRARPAGSGLAAPEAGL